MAVRTLFLYCVFTIALGAGTGTTCENQKGDHWDYTLPQCWKNGWAVCAGRQQSPINIDTGRITVKGKLANLSTNFKWTKAANLKLENTGHGLKVQAETKLGQKVIMKPVDGLLRETYNVLQFHLHFPSEHAIDGALMAGELHIVHQEVGKTNLDGLLVVGVFFDVGAENNLLKLMGLPSGAPQNKGEKTAISSEIDLKTELLSVMDGGFYRYEGSLTTPPCSETVNWFVMKKKLTASSDQVQTFKNLIGTHAPGNNRPLQLLYGRTVVEDTFLGCPSRQIRVDGRKLAGNWDYIAPQCWAQIDKNYNACDGKKQSPMNLASPSQTGNTTLAAAFDYKDVANLTFKNNGHAYQLDGVSTSLGRFKHENNDTYNVLQFHWHCPSEHAIDGKLFACELHIVHQKQGSNGTNDLLVVGLFFELVPSGGETFLDDFPFDATTAHMNSTVNSVKLKTLMDSFGSSPFFRYGGSLTTPPCSETVQWFVLENRAKISFAQEKQLRKHVPINNRPLQLRNGRELLKSLWTATNSAVPAPADCSRRLAGGKWNYHEPQCWEKQYPLCGGQKQSPINIDQAGPLSASGNVKLWSFLQYKAADGTVKNTGHGLQVDAPASGAFGYLQMTADLKYKVLQFHIHCPTEHTFVVGKKHITDLVCELHIVHQKHGSTGTDDLLVIGLMYKESATESPLLKKMGLPDDAPVTKDQTKQVNQVDLSTEFETALKGDFYRYDGSLTTPPCSETVSWFVMKNTMDMTQQQYLKFNAIFQNPSNARPVQLLHGRGIMMNQLPGCSVEPTKNGTSRLRRLGGVSSKDYINPQCWANKHAACAGMRQSPINVDIQKSKDPNAKPRLVQRIYRATKLTVKNVGASIQVQAKDAGNMGTSIWGSGKYNVLQLHLHFPAEHAIDGKLADGELHIVHQKEGSSNELLVMGIMLTAESGAAANAGLTSMGLEDASKTWASKDIDEDLFKLFQQQVEGTNYFTYLGSLTTPPCSETVQWVVYDKPVKIATSQMQAFQKLFPPPMNNRPLQPLNGRVIQKNTDLSPAPAPTTTPKAANVGSKAGARLAIFLAVVMFCVSIPSGQLS